MLDAIALAIGYGVLASLGVTGAVFGGLMFIWAASWIGARLGF